MSCTKIPARHKHKEYVEESAVKKQQEESGYESIKASKHDLDLLRYLSMDGRAPVHKIAKGIGLSRTATEYNIKKAEEKYGIKYIPEIKIENIGYLKYIAFVKFEKEMPKFDDLKEALNLQPTIQLGLLTQGNYDLVIQFVAKSNRDVTIFVHKLRTETIFKNYKSKWYISPYFDSYGFVPLRDLFIESLKEKVWHRTKETPRPLPTDLTN